MRQRDAEGFSVIEALVAVAIIGIAMVPIVSMQTQMIRQYQRQQALQEQLAAQRNALALLREINVMAEPSGRRGLAQGRALAWQAVPISAPQRSIRFLAGEGDFTVSLYRVDAVVRGADGRRIAVMTIDQLGWQPFLPRSRAMGMPPVSGSPARSSFRS
jgi:general secretion pathway protein I